MPKASQIIQGLIAIHSRRNDSVVPFCCQGGLGHDKEILAIGADNPDVRGNRRLPSALLQGKDRDGHMVHDCWRGNGSHLRPVALLPD